MYALYKNMSLSVSFSGDEGFKEETQVEVFNSQMQANIFSIVSGRRWLQLGRHVNKQSAIKQ